MLGTVALLGTAGVLTWGMVTVADLRSSGSARSIDSAVSADQLAVPPRIEQSEDFAAAFGALPEASVSDWKDDLDLLSKQPIAPPAYVDDLKAGLPDRAPDLPHPAPPISLSDLESQQAKSPVVPVPQLPVQRQMHHMRDPKPEVAQAAAPKPHRLAARSSYVEKIVEQGDAGDVKFRYRRHVCAPPHMVDVCYMPPENRRAIVVKQW
jgi:hypothetical protein